MPIKIDQIAFGTRLGFEETIHMLSGIFGLNLDDWVYDTVEGDCQLLNDWQMQPHKNKAKLAFHYGLMPIEFEVLQYIEGRNWHDEIKDSVFLSHLGIHAPTQSVFSHLYVGLSKYFSIAQELQTVSHTNELIKNCRRYNYVIFNSRKQLGFDIKIIQRLDLKGNPYVKSNLERRGEILKEIDSLEQKANALKDEYTKLLEGKSND